MGKIPIGRKDTGTVRGEMVTTGGQTQWRAGTNLNTRDHGSHRRRGVVALGKNYKGRLNHRGTGKRIRLEE